MKEERDSFRFRDWPVYKDTRAFRMRVMKIVKTFPSEEKYALADQAKRALNSIMLNLAEGANKNTDKDTRLFVNRAHCSLDEVVACTDCAVDDGYMTEAQQKEILRDADALAKQMKGFSMYLSRSVPVKDKGLEIKDSAPSLRIKD